MKQILVEAHGGPEQLKLHDGLLQEPGPNEGRGAPNRPSCRMKLGTPAASPFGGSRATTVGKDRCPGES
jgi:hypothetical protein